MRRVIQILDSLDGYGTEAFILNVFRNIDRKEIMFDFLVSRHTGSQFEKEAESLGAKIYTFSHRRLGWRKHIKSLHSFFKDNAEKYDAAHIHGNSFTGMMPLAIAGKYHIPILIAHCHSSSAERLHNKLLHALNRMRIYKLANNFLCCSEAAKFFGYRGTKAFEKAKIINNGITLETFKYNNEARNKLRNELNLENSLVIGNVAAFREVKNHEFMINIFQEVVTEAPDAKLLLVGDGILRPYIRECVEKKGLSDKVIFTGRRSDIPELLSAMDVFLFPSKYEGLGISLIEAQASGLPVMASSTIPPETKVTPLIQYLPLDFTPLQWAKNILKAPRPDRNLEYPQLKLFDIKVTVNRLSEIYLS